jgi:hypothetical protein
VALYKAINDLLDESPHQAKAVSARVNPELAVGKQKSGFSFLVTSFFFLR